MRAGRPALSLVTACMAVLATAACTVGLAEQTAGDLTFSLSSGRSVRVGKQRVIVRIVRASHQPAGDLEVVFHYYPFVHRVKDQLASPDEVVRVVPATLGPEGYGATLELDRPGPWKVAVRVRRADRPDTIVYFTLDAEESPRTGR